ncbi:Peptide methionine sulfoxide reductase [Folsomia candida]|uniref:peptide-methionine (S)-S-oxide reductase n=2 Tax=Folsomia candida TaxID=158441 RepID=A0A226DBX1_FOLCA|nr:Peptide methionine sulfoxide reductase [Folsomia candida]
MGCCKSKDVWQTNFKATELSSNKCDAEWEEIMGNPATFAMGSHWGPAARFGAIPGVIRVRVGFTGGTEEEPMYNDPKDHIEAVSLQFDPDRVTYQRLLELFWDYHDWTLENPHQYSSFIFCHDEEQKSAAEASFLEMLKKTEKKVRTKIGTYTQFWQADDDFQHNLLQQHKNIFPRLHIPFVQLAHSHLATRVEGYVCGYAKPELFDDEVAELYLPTTLSSDIRKECMANQPSDEGVDKFPL